MKKRIDNDLIEEIKNANDIVSVISEYVALKKKGKNYWGCCPFHNEKTPSFSVTPEKGFYYCFGCGASGNVFNFLINHEHYTFMEAVEKLANRANIALPVMELSDEERYRESQKQEMYKVNEMAATFFHNCLMQTGMGKEGLSYLRNRGLSMDTINKFRLGFAPDNWDKLYKAFIERGVTEKVLLQLGLCRESNGKVYDYFRNRVMFPICDGKGRVVAFGGRVLDDSTPKYLNSPETEIFNKRRLLFGFDKAYRAIREKKQAILVEGYMDVISAHNRGISNVVASLGTAYTKEHGQLLMRQTEEIVLAYDMDGAGQKAARRAIELLQNTDFKVRIVAMPDGKDPDDYVRNHGPSEFLKLVDTAMRPFDFLLNHALLTHDRSDLNGKLAILEEVFPYIGNTNSQVQREDYLRSLALPLWLDNSTIFRYFRNYLAKGEVKLFKSTPKEGDLSSMEKYTDEDIMVAMALSNTEGLVQLLTYLPLTDLNSSIHQEMITKAQTVFSKEGKLTETLLKEEFSDQEYGEFTRLMVICPNTEYNEYIFNGYLKAVRLQSLRKQYKEHSLLADKLNREGDSTFIIELKKCQELQTLIKEWS